MLRRLAALLVFAVPAAAAAQATVAVDATADVHAISPLIYGMNYADGPRIDAAHVPLTRWGGNSTSRYNYQIDVSNTGSDYYFENIPGCWGTAGNCSPAPANPQETSGANAYLQAAATDQIVALLTVPTIGWVAKAPPVYGHPFPCGCTGAGQDSYDPWDAPCGDGQIGGAWIDCGPATNTSTAVDAAWTTGWVTYLVGKFGASNAQRIYELDNEPNLWDSTHHDVHPTALTYDELWQRMRDNAIAILDADPTAEVAGPAEWGWPNYFCSAADNISAGCFPTSPDRANHGGEELVAWLLDQAHAYELAHGRRILHYLDLHYYPQGGDPPAITRSLWDPTYTDPSWINDTIRLIPRMRDWVSQHYPGTKLLVSEYDFYHHTETVGAVTYAEVLGIFGREGLDAATAWGPPAPGEAAFGAYKLYRNYDGSGGHFESTNARATVAGSATVQAYAATGASGATVALVNEGGATASVTVTFAGFTADAPARWYTNGSGDAITRQADVTVTGGAATVSLGATMIGMLVVPGATVTPDGGVQQDGPAAQQDAPVVVPDGPAAHDAAPLSDGGAGIGDGATPPDDGGATPDGRSSHGVTSGCGCRTAAPAPGGALLVLGLVALRLARRRRG